MTIRPWVKQFASEWQTKTGYEASPDMVSAVCLVILAADPFGVSRDDQDYIKTMTNRILDASLTP